MNLKIEALKSYIIDARAAGVLDDRIKINLTQNGWSEDLIELAFEAPESAALTKMGKADSFVHQTATLLVFIFIKLPVYIMCGVFAFCIGLSILNEIF